MNGTIFDIKEFSIHDGPGGRITVFFKGCPLRCKWCHNPEGLSEERQIMYKKNLCIHCGKCMNNCSHEECKEFDRCIHACVNGCLSVSGEVISSDLLAERINSNADILNRLGGGVTFSGGEPLIQADFLCEVAGKLKSIHTAVQTSGYANAEVYKRVVESVDFVMQDIKLVDNEKHIQYTGVSNEAIIRNIKYLKTSGKAFVFRVPMIPNITDTPENLNSILALAGNSPIEFLPYNTMAGAKYDLLGMKYSLEGNQSL